MIRHSCCSLNIKLVDKYEAIKRYEQKTTAGHDFAFLPADTPFGQPDFLGEQSAALEPPPGYPGKTSDVFDLPFPEYSAHSFPFFGPDRSICFAAFFIVLSVSIRHTTPFSDCTKIPFG
jgi:hypothetical protein